MDIPCRSDLSRVIVVLARAGTSRLGGLERGHIVNGCANGERRASAARQQRSILVPSKCDEYHPPHLELGIPRRVLQEYRELILNKRSIKATRGLWPYGWHIDRYGLRLAGPQYALSIDTRSLSKADSEYSLDKRAVSAGEYRIPGVVTSSHIPLDFIGVTDKMRQICANFIALKGVQR